MTSMLIVIVYRTDFDIIIDSRVSITVHPFCWPRDWFWSGLSSSYRYSSFLFPCMMIVLLYTTWTESTSASFWTEFFGLTAETWTVYEPEPATMPGVF